MSPDRQGSSPPRCAHCGCDIPADALFCPYCGVARAPTALAGASRPGDPAGGSASIAADLPRGERRNATVLFADLSGYTELNQTLDPEEVARVMNRLKIEATRIIESHGGTVNQFVGDEVMALFGVPRAHEDDPVRAVRAAIELRDDVRALGRELALRLGRSLRLHTGVNTGLMITQLRDRRDGLYGVTGDAVNTAARLAVAAADDEILVGPATQRAIQAMFETEPVGPLQLRGWSEPLVTHRVLRPVPTRDAGSSVREASDEFVGRIPEMQKLERYFEEARSGRGGLVGIAGEVGVGKSRLFEEFARALPSEALVLAGQCPSFGSVAPYQPFREVLSRALLEGEDAGSDLERVTNRVERELAGCAPHLPILLSLLSLRDDEPVPAADAASSQAAILGALQAVLTALARSRPLVLLLSDWHWADPASEQALVHLAEDLAGERLLLLVNFRSHYQPRWKPQAPHLDLLPLGAEDTRPIVRRILGDTAPETLVRRIFERTGGNPLFVEELCSALRDLGSASGVQPEKLVEELVPDNVAAVLRARVDRLSPGSAELLRRASVLGQTFSMSLLRDLCEDERDVDDAFAELVRSGLLQESGDGDLVRFKHALVRDVAYDMLLRKRRRELHGAVGCAIEQREQEHIHEHVERLAHHFARSEDRDKAVHYLARSADKAVAAGAMVQALSLYLEALRVLETMPETPAQMRQRVGITMKLANAAIYRPSKQMRGVLRSCFEISERLGDPRALSRSLYWMGWLESSLGHFPEGRVHCERAIAIAEQQRDGKLLSLLYSNLGQAFFHTGDYPSASRLLDRAVVLRRSISGDTAAVPVISYSLAYQAMIDADTGRFDLADRRLAEAAALGRSGGMLQIEAALASMRAVVELFRGDWAACRQSAAELGHKSRRIGSTYMQAMSLALGGYASCFEGEVAHGVAGLRAGIELLEQSEVVMTLSFLYACLAEVLVMEGEIAEAELLVERALEHVERGGDRMGEPPAYRVLLLIALQRTPGERERIDAALAAATDAARRRGSVRDDLIAVLRAAEGLAESDPGWARDRLRSCAERFHALGMDWYAAHAGSLRARLGAGAS